jgi:GT2 family glycosyltransferase
VEVAREAGATVVEMGRNAGFAPAVNRGISESLTEWVAIVNNDVALEPDWLRELLSAASQTGASFAAGKLLKASNPGIIDGTFDLVCTGGTAWRAGAERPDGPQWDERRRISFAPLTAAVFRREVFDVTGLLDERFESYLEDVDLGLRCSASSLTGVYAPSGHGLHEGSATRGPWHTATVRQMARNQKFIQFKHFRSGPRWPALVAQLLWALLSLKHGTARAWLAGWREASRRKPEFQIDTSSNWIGVRESVQASENEILRYQQETGFDSYWRWYFLLTRGLR